MECKVGASAVLYRNGGVKSKLRYQLGSLHHHTVYEGEGIRILLGTKLIREQWGIWSANIYIDNCASIAATTLTKPNPGHYIFDAIHDSIVATCKKHPSIKIKIKWVPGHKGVQGNKMVDEQVKKAIIIGNSDLDRLPTLLQKTLPHSKSALKQAHSKRLKQKTQKIWLASKRYDHMKKMDPIAPLNKYVNLITPLPRKLASILFQL